MTWCASTAITLPTVTLRYFGQELFEQSAKKGGSTAPAISKPSPRAAGFRLTKAIDAALRTHRLDALVAPTGGPAWSTPYLVNGDCYTGGSATPAAVAGYPNITVPAGLLHGLPIGISFFGAAWSEPVLFAIAYAYEQRTRHRTKPRFLPTVEAF